MDLEETKLKLRFIELLVLISTLLVSIRKPTGDILPVFFLAFLAFSIIYYAFTIQGYDEHSLTQTIPIGLFFAATLTQVFSGLAIDDWIGHTIFLTVFTGLITVVLLPEEKLSLLKDKIPYIRNLD